MVIKFTNSKNFILKYILISILIVYVLTTANPEPAKEKKQKVIGCVRLTKARVFLDSNFFDEIEKNHDPNGKLDYKAKLMSAGLLNCVRTITLEKAKTVKLGYININSY